MIVKKFRVTILFLICILFQFSYTSHSEIEKSHYFINSKTASDTILLLQPDYPVFKTILQTGLIRSRFDCFGTIGAGLGLPIGPIDYITESPDPSFENPPLSGHEYLFLNAIWVGGIVNQDTLVSVGFDGWSSTNEFKPPHFPDSGSIFEFNSSSDLSFTAIYTDTITAGVQNDYSGRPHIPMNIKINASPHLFYDERLKNVIFYDVSVENIGEDNINEAFIGIYTDADIGSRVGPYTESLNRDDISGSFIDKKLAYSFDNSGDPQDSISFGIHSVLNAIGTKVIATSKTPEVENFNWWVSNSYDLYDYGPRKKGTPEDPFRDFGTGGLGTPEGDANKYYILSHPEWDFDQVRVSEITEDDSIWVSHPQIPIEGGPYWTDTRNLLSFGPYDIAPDSVVRFVYALFIGNDLHQVPDNLKNLTNQDINTYVNNLSFDDLLATAEAVDTMAEFFLDPLNQSPISRIEYQSDDSVVISWVRWASDASYDIEGYNIYLREATQADLPFPGALPPWFTPDESDLRESIGKENKFTFTNLDRNKVYTCNIVHRTATGIGNFSNAIVFNQRTIDQAPATKHNFAFYTEGNPVTLEWESDIPDINHFNIYKFPHLSDTKEIYHPFYSKLSHIDDKLPLDSIDVNGVLYYYYAMELYAQVDGNTFSWQDNQIFTDQYDSTSYIISSVSSSGFESSFSEPLLVHRVSETVKDILVLTHFSTLPYYATNLEQKISFYQSVLDGYSFDIFDVNDTVSSYSCYNMCIDVSDFSKYKIVILDNDITPSFIDNLTSMEMEKFLNNGGIFVYFGTLAEFEPRPISAPVITTPNSIFSRNLFGIDSTSYISFVNYLVNEIYYDSVIAFSYAEPTNLIMPPVKLDTTVDYFANFPSQIEASAPLDCPFNVATFTPNENAEVLYRFKSSNPSESIFENRPIGVKTETKNSLSYLFGFHLYYMEQQDARQLIDYIYNYEPDDSPVEILPDNIYLSQNFPNPFNHSTRIEFALDKPIQVSLAIYNILGQKVTTLVHNQNLVAGNHVYYWDAKNNAGKDVSTGMYFYRLETIEQNITKKMVFLK